MFSRLPWWRPKKCRPALPSGRSWPRISIVTPTYNQGRYIEETILSVAEQGYPDLEHIVIDGGSGDETISILERHAKRLSYWESQRDRGQSHAINKGFARATGEILTWLNSDDRLAPGALESVAFARDLSNADMFAGICTLFDETGVRVHHLTACASGLLSLEDFLDEQLMAEGWSFYQPEVMFTRDLWERAGGHVDEDLHYVMDYDLWLRFAAAGARLHVIGRPIAQLRFHVAQKTSQISLEAEIAAKHAVEVRTVRSRYSDRDSHPTHFPQRHFNGKRNSGLLVECTDVVGLPYDCRVSYRRAIETLAYAGHDVVLSGSSELTAHKCDASPRPDLFLLPESVKENNRRFQPLLKSNRSSPGESSVNTGLDISPTVRAVPGLPTHVFYPRDKAALRLSLGLPRWRRIIAISEKRLAELSDLGELLQALRRRRITFLVLGARPVFPHSPYAVGTGPIADELRLAEWLACADIYLAIETGGLSGQYAIEAALCGVPTIGFNESSFKEGGEVIDGVSGILVPSGRKDAFVQAIRQLLDDPSLRSSLGHWARLAFEPRRSYAGSYHLLHRDLLERGVLQAWRDRISIRFDPALGSTFPIREPQSEGEVFRPFVGPTKRLVLRPPTAPDRDDRLVLVPTPAVLVAQAAARRLFPAQRPGWISRIGNYIFHGPQER